MTLTYPEFLVAVQAATLRMSVSIAAGLNAATTYRRTWVERIAEETVGACGEVALAKWAGVWFVPSVNTFHRVPDCLGDIEVRATTRPDGSLIVRDNDSDARRYVLAVVAGPEVDLCGWVWGSEAKRDQWLRNPHGHRQSWFVPRQALRAMETLER